jgi:mRNA-degrading endonuclease RelE of RelBE toxin-antitoxin system
MYKVTLLSYAEHSYKKLDVATQKSIAKKIDWLSENAERIIHHPLTSLPDDLRGLCRMRCGDYRILYWIYFQSHHIKIYEIEHRKQNYHSLKP